MKAFVNRHPLSFSLLLVLFLVSSVVIFHALFPAISAMTVGIIFTMMQAGVVVLLVALLGWWRDTGFAKLPQWRDLPLYWPVLMPVLALVLQGVTLSNLGMLPALFLLSILIGIGEEGIFRGLILRALEPAGIMRAAGISGLLFGLVHATNLFIGQDPVYTLFQVVSNIPGGFALAAMRFRSRSIWLLVAIHMINDFSQFVTRESPQVTQTPVMTMVLMKLGFNVLLAAYGLYLLRNEWLPKRKAMVAASESAQ